MHSSQGRKFTAPFKTLADQRPGKDILSGLSQPSTQGSGCTWSIVAADDDTSRDQTNIIPDIESLGLFPDINCSTSSQTHPTLAESNWPRNEQATPVKTLPKKTPQKNQFSFCTPTSRKLVVAIPARQYVPSKKRQSKQPPKSSSATRQTQRKKPRVPAKKPLKQTDCPPVAVETKKPSVSTPTQPKHSLPVDMVEVTPKAHSLAAAGWQHDNPTSATTCPPKSPAIYDFELSPDTVRKATFKKNKRKAQARMKKQLLRTLAQMQEEIHFIRQRRDALREIIQRKQLDKSWSDVHSSRLSGTTLGAAVALSVSASSASNIRLNTTFNYKAQPGTSSSRQGERMGFVDHTRIEI